MNPETRKRLEELRKKAEKAVGRAVARERRLFGAGVPLHDEERHMELLRAIRAERNAVLSGVRREAQGIIEEQRRQLERALDFPRDSVLGPVSRGEVSTRLPFIEREVSAMNAGQIRSRLEYVLEHGSLSEKFCHWSAARSREYAILERRAAASGDGPATRQVSHTAFSAILDDLDRHLFEGAYQERTQYVQEALDAAEELAKFAYTRSRDAQSMAAAYRRSNSAIRPIVEHQRYARGDQRPAPAVEPPAKDSAIANG